MLVVSRKTHQQIRIGDAITVTILRVRGRVVRVGVEAPKDIRIARSELDCRVPHPVPCGAGPSDEGKVRRGRAAKMDRAAPAVTDV